MKKTPEEVLRKALELRDEQAMSYAEIARALGLTTSEGARQVVVRARVRLQGGSQETAPPSSSDEPAAAEPPPPRSSAPPWQVDLVDRVKALSSTFEDLRDGLRELQGGVDLIAKRLADGVLAGAGASPSREPDMARVREQLEKIAEAVGVQSRRINDRQRDAPAAVVGRMLEVCLNELGVDYVSDQLGIGRKVLERVLHRGAPPVVSDFARLERLYVCVRIWQLDIEPGDDDVEVIRQAVRRRNDRDLAQRAFEGNGT